MYINNLPSVLRNCNYHVYADDVQLYIETSIDDVGEAIAALNDNISKLNDWSHMHGLDVNPSKCKAIIIGSNRRISVLDELATLDSIRLGSTIIDYENQVKSLGILIDRTMNWSGQITSLCSKVYGGLRQLRLFASSFPIDIRIRLVQALIMPFFDYACLAYCDLTSEKVTL